ncbi:helix-turn-helix transcriptional regulator [Bacillus sp. APMAM]|uniref:DNA-binding Xre family transcriptional regulator n=1 Tax=Anoxybacillus andreesenii TaxID=1325932 RepID=A0ABT9VAL0_9BACL|nr:helix-turn-helix transcriptional regulator [Robertmurraya andreesenii]MBB2483124.1 helix-turn-helix transcriptional regulator [Bacillus sp. APMAM]MDQ0157955.1 DNA-binding Xre family transcriptional regulator [Robertmurraya andreesenii]RTZ53441.1 XRE family transcriptional regulator [Bacillus sp. SAJ1]
MARKVEVKIHKLANQRGISLRELSRLTDIRHAALSELANQKRQNINFSHIERIADALELDDIREIIDLIKIKDK